MILTPEELEALTLSLKVAISAVVVGLPLAIAAAYVLARSEFPGKSIIDGLIHAPLVLPPVVIGYLLLMLFAPNGTFGGWLSETFGITLAFNWYGAALAALIMAFPLMVRSIRLVIEARTEKLEQVARTLGAGRVRAFATITLPLAIPGIISGAMLGFARALGEFGATITFVASIPGLTRTLPLALFDATERPGGEAAALRLMILSLLLAVAALVLSEWLARRARKRLEGGT